MGKRAKRVSRLFPSALGYAKPYAVFAYLEWCFA